mgnify:CR=1 FL=1
MVLEAIQTRLENFPGENPTVAMAVVMFNIGDRFTKLECMEQEWKGVKADVIPEDGPPHCPNGHPLRQGPTVKLGWVEVE